MRAKRFVVRCQEWQSPPMTKEDAERRAVRITEMGECPHDHEVTEIST